jgi:small subunit ribosomal protein S6
MEETKNDNRVYELAFLIVPTMVEESTGAKFGDIKAFVEDNSGVVLSSEMPKMIDLAYEMNRTIENKKTWFNQGYFSWIKFEAPAEFIDVLDKKLKFDEEIIRYMTIKTVRENTIASKKSFGRTGDKKKKTSSEEDVASDKKVVPEMTSEEIDQQIEALIEE